MSNRDFEIRQDIDGDLLGAEDFADGSDADALAQDALASIKAGLRGADALEAESAVVGMRPIPADDLPIVGFNSRIDGIYVAAMHAGITLVPAIGRFAATEILDGENANILETCRPDRFTGAYV